jgi:hypothetical protein
MEFYKDSTNGLYRINNQIIPSDQYRIYLRGGNVIDMRDVTGNETLFTAQDVTLLTKEDLSTYADIDEFINANIDFFDGSGTLSNKDGVINVQNPLAVDGDSVHAKDVDVANSIMGDFSGEPTDIFNDLNSEIVNNTATNPKLLTIAFQRTLVTNLVGLGSSQGGSFSNVKAIGIVSGGVEITLADYTTDNTDRTSQFFIFPNSGLNALRLEFHTADTISLTNCFIPKLRPVSAILEAAVKYATSYQSPYLLNGASQDMNVDGSDTPVDFVHTCTGLTRCTWQRSFIDLQDGNTNFNPEDFGAITGGLTNGVEIIVVKDGVETLMETWKTNMDISMTMYNFDSPYRAGAYIGRWTITSDIGSPITLFQGDQVILRVNDNLTGPDAFRMRLKLSQ